MFAAVVHTAVGAVGAALVLAKADILGAEADVMKMQLIRDIGRKAHPITTVICMATVNVLVRYAQDGMDILVYRLTQLMHVLEIRLATIGNVNNITAAVVLNRINR